MITFFFFSDKMVRRFFCPNKCGRSYKNKCSINRHLKFECGVQPQFKCYICYKKFAHNSKLKEHLGLVHNIL